MAATVAVGDEKKSRSRSHDEGCQGREGNGKRQLVETDAGHLQDGDLVVAREPSHADQDRDQKRDRDGEHEKGGHQEKHQLCNVPEADPLVDHQIHQLQDLPHEENEGQYKENHAEGNCDFLEDVAVDQATHAEYPVPGVQIIRLRGSMKAGSSFSMVSMILPCNLFFISAKMGRFLLNVFANVMASCISASSFSQVLTMI